MKNGLPLTLLSVAALAAAGAVRRRGSFSTLPDASLDTLGDGDAFDPERPYTVTSMRDATVTFDPSEGIGAVPDNANITYTGFVVWMPVSDWLALNPPIEPQSDRVKGLASKLREGAAFGPRSSSSRSLAGTAFRSPPTTSKRTSRPCSAACGCGATRGATGCRRSATSPGT
jgi:hypothetical protein